MCPYAALRKSSLALASTFALASFAAGAALAGPFQTQGIFQFGPAHIGIAFTDSVDVAKALQRSRYTVTPQAGGAAVALQGAALQENQRTVILTTVAGLPQNTAFDVAIAGLTSRGGAPLEPGGPTSFATVDGVVTGIADVHANINSLLGRSIVILGQVFITGASSGGTPSAYVQDGTGRGLNLFGASPDPAAVNDVGNVVRATGTVALYFTTVELTPFTASVVAAGMPRLAPRVLTVPQASSPQWEGTYIQTSATLTAPPSASGANNYNYPAMDQGVPFTFRIRNATGINPGGFIAGDVVTGAGAGAVFQGVYQAGVGNAFDFYRGRGPGDITPPSIVSATGLGGESIVTLEFSEPIGAGGSAPANYLVYAAASPASPIVVSEATVSGSSVTLALAAPLAGGTEYVVEVSNVQDSSGNPIGAGTAIAFTATVPVPYGVAGVHPFGADFVMVAFTAKVNASQATRLDRYTFTPALALAQATLQENGQTVILRCAAAPPAGASYTVRVSGIASATGEALASEGPFDLAIPAETVTNIATVQNNLGAYGGQIVTMIGQVFIPVGSRGGTPSGYMQDGSGRGINLFGGSIQGPVNELGSLVMVTGTISVYFTTTEVTSYSVTRLASGLPHLGAKVVSLAGALRPEWEGTYIEAGGTLSSIAASGTGNYSFTATEGGLSLTFRVGNGLGIQPTQFAVGDEVTGRGAGGSFQSTYQVNVGNRQDFFKAGAGGPDRAPPVVSNVQAAHGEARLTVGFNEPVRTNEATLLSSYRVSISGSPLDSIRVLDVVLAANARSATLTLESALTVGHTYRLEVFDVADLAGNAILAGAYFDFTATEPLPESARLRGLNGARFPATTLVRNLSRQGEIFRFEIGGVPGTRAVCRIFDMQGRMVKVLYDATLAGTGTVVLSWDARDEEFEYSPTGLYIVHLQTTDTSGNVSETSAPLVVAVRLHR